MNSLSAVRAEEPSNLALSKHQYHISYLRYTGVVAEVAVTIVPVMNTVLQENSVMVDECGARINEASFVEEGCDTNRSASYRDAAATTIRRHCAQYFIVSCDKHVASPPA
ncbi:hypothetical protein WJ97_11890 [Burkholderia ubonensis]|nr:hypothetical protein WJ97_11890 [Burkholderia ubonensis]